MNKSNIENLSLKTLRRRAAEANLRVWTFSEGTRHYNEIGPFALVDRRTNAIVARNLKQPELLMEVESRRASTVAEDRVRRV